MPFNSSHTFVYVFVYDSIRRLQALYNEHPSIEEDQEVGYGGATLYYNEHSVSVALTQHDLYMRRVDPRYKRRAIIAKTAADENIDQCVSNGV